MSDWEREQLQNYLRQDKDFAPGAVRAILIGGGVAFAVTCALTQPWPGKGAAAYGKNLAGPGITIVVTIVTMLILGRLLRRRTPLRAPRLGVNDPPPPPTPTPPATRKP